MGIEVTTIKLNTTGTDPFSIDVVAANAESDVVANDLRQRLSGAQCEKHPNVTSTITLRADRQKRVVVEKHFCCDDFASRINVEL